MHAVALTGVLEQHLGLARAHSRSAARSPQRHTSVYTAAHTLHNLRSVAAAPRRNDGAAQSRSDHAQEIVAAEGNGVSRGSSDASSWLGTVLSGEQSDLQCRLIVGEHRAAAFLRQPAPARGIEVSAT